MKKCDYCKHPAVVNYQKVWVSWQVLNNDTEGNYGYSKDHKLELDIEEPTGQNNVHLCEECQTKWLNNEL